MARLAKTAARGYSGPHARRRAQDMARYQPGQPCAECGQPLEPWQPMHLMHDHVNGGYLGLGHQSCNIGEANRRRARRRSRPRPRRYNRW